MFDFGVDVTFAWLPALISGLASVGGALFANNANRQQARDQMGFQERMANTQAQRSIEDFKAAGLNPALAYGTQAPTPMGAKADVQNPAAAGLSTALNVAQAKAQIGKTEAETRATETNTAIAETELARRSFTENGEPTFKDEWIAQRRQLIRDLEQRAGVQPHELRSVRAAADRAEAEAAIRKLDIPKAEAEAWIYKTFGSAVPAAGMLGSTAKSLVGLSAGGRAGRLGRAVIQKGASAVRSRNKFGPPR